MVKAYAIEELRFMFTTDDGSDGPRVLELLQRQPELDYVEVDSHKHFGRRSHSEANPGALQAHEARVTADAEARRARHERSQRYEEGRRAKGVDPFKEGLNRPPGWAEREAAELQERRKRRRRRKRRGGGRRAEL